MICNRFTADKKLRRMAMEVAERNIHSNDLILIGIKENGIYIAHKIAAYLQEVYNGKLQVISLLLDKKDPGKIILSEEIEFNNRSVLLIDDVANTGKTMLYALKPILLQKPSQIETMVLVERTHKKFPIAVNYVGLSVSTTMQQNIVVDVEDGEITGARLI